MGAWGPDIFADDFACDLREEFRELIAEGLSSEDATQKLQAEHAIEDDPDERSVFYLALAATQWKLGRLLDPIRDEAIRIIDSGEEIERWKARLIDADEIGAIKRRQAALDRLRKQLLKPQPKPKKIRVPYASRTDWEIGYAVAYRLLSGRYVVLRVVGIIEQGRGRDALVDLADWIGDAPPTRVQIQGLPRMPTARFAIESRSPGEEPPALKIALLETPAHKRDALIDNFMKNPWIFAGGRRGPPEDDGKFRMYEEEAGEIPLDRLKVIATDLELPPASEEGISVFGGWSALDGYLEERFDLR